MRQKIHQLVEIHYPIFLTSLVNLFNLLFNMLRMISHQTSVTPRIKIPKVYSKSSYAFLDLRSSEYTCAPKSTCFISRIIKCDYNFTAIAPFSVGCFSGGTCRTDKIKTSVYDFKMLLWSIIAVELTNPLATQNQVWDFNQQVSKPNKARLAS